MFEIFFHSKLDKPKIIIKVINHDNIIIFFNLTNMFRILVFYFSGGCVPLIVVLCSTLRPTSLLGACVLG